jgi:hypothetical protein
MNLDRRRQLRLVLMTCTALLSGGLLLVAPAAHAALGSTAASIEADRNQLQAQRTVTAHDLYEVHELTLPTGTTLREYRAPDGIVFAVAWTGPAKPDLSQALGAYFPGYLEAARGNGGGHNHIAATRADLVVVSSGHMRAFSGRAYLASAIPAGVSLDEIR